MWPGSEAVIHGLQATHVDKFNQLEPLPNKVDRVLSWLDLDDSDRPAFIAAYVPTIDVSTIHEVADFRPLDIGLALMRLK